MKFEDYNYAMYNPYILVPDRDADDKIDVMDNVLKLSENHLLAYRMPDYEHDTMSQPASIHQSEDLKAKDLLEKAADNSSHQTNTPPHEKLDSAEYSQQ